MSEINDLEKAKQELIKKHECKITFHERVHLTHTLAYNVIEDALKRGIEIGEENCYVLDLPSKILDVKMPIKHNINKSYPDLIKKNPCKHRADGITCKKCFDKYWIDEEDEIKK